MKILRLITAALLCTASIPAMKAQMPSSPYSMYGYGLLNDHATSSQRAMGGVGYALHSYGAINVKNPASYAAIDSMTFLFDIGVNCGSVKSSQGKLAGKKTLGGLDYVTLQVPVTKWMGVSAGMLPYSSVGYQFGNEIVNGESAYQGSGGISEAFIGLGVKPVKGLSIGANVGYLFGNIINDVYVYADHNASTSLYEKVLRVRDYDLQFGVQYALTFAKRHTVTLGATFSPAKDAHGHGYGVIYDVATSSAAPDTIGYSSLKGGYSMPWGLGVGLAYQWNRKLTVAADFTYQPWSKAKFNGIEGFSSPSVFADRYKGALGAEFIPALRGNYLQCTSYRIGAFYSRDYMMVGTNHVREYGLTCGFGFPTPMRTKVNIGFEYRHRATSPVSTVSENYFMVTLGVALNEIWFVPSKIR